MEKRIFLASPHMSEEGYEKEYIKEAFDTNWIAPLGENVRVEQNTMSPSFTSNAFSAICIAAVPADNAAPYFAPT